MLVTRWRSVAASAAVAVLIGLAPAAYAAPASLSLTAPASLAVGRDIEARITLTDAAGGALADEPVELRGDGQPVRRARTDAAGTVTLAIASRGTGQRTLWASFPGDGTHGPAGATTAVSVRAAVLSIRTVPPIARIPFTLGGTRFTSGADGVATVAVGEAGTYTLSADVPDDMQVDADTRVSFVRWDGSEFYPRRQVAIAGDTELQLGLALSHPVRLHAVDLTGTAVPSSRVTSLTVQASTGTRFTFHDMGPHWLMANRVQRLRNGMIATPVQYAVASAMVGGSNVVNRFQQRYEVQGGDDWEVSLLLYDAALRGRDALFGTAVGHGVILSYPDGRTVEHPFGADGVARFESLARGTYNVRVAGAAGFAPVAPLALSRNQDTSIKVLSVLDMAVLGGAVLGLAIGLMVLGRGVPWSRRRRGRRALAASPLQVGVAGRDLDGAAVFEASGAAGVGTSTALAADAQQAHGERGKATARGWHLHGDGRDERRFTGLLGREGR